MTFFDISRKMLKAGFYKYRLYVLCNLSATALFCCFAVISTNRTFMNASIVNSSISNNIYLPFFLSAVFLVFFLPVSCQAFLASRKQEYGVMFSLGMSRKEAFRNLLFENVIISVLALAIALAAGTVLSFLFFSVIIYAIDVHGVQWQFCPEAYKPVSYTHLSLENLYLTPDGKIGGLPGKAADLINKTKDNAKIERIKDALINIIGHNRISGDLGIPDFTSEFQFSNGAFSVADSGFTVDMAALDRRLTPQPHDNMYSDMYEYSFRKVL